MISDEEEDMKAFCPISMDVLKEPYFL